MRRQRKGWAPRAGLGLSVGLSIVPGYGRPVAPEPVPPAAGRAAESALQDLLARQAVYHDAFARRTLYTWTTPDQIQEIRLTGRLLLRTESPTRGRSGFERTLAGPPHSGTDMARLLETPRFARKRFAWPNPWATVDGWPGETYGDRLVEVRIKEEAIVGRFLPAADPSWTFADAAGSPVRMWVVLANPSRLAAVYYASEPSRSGTGSFARYSRGYREHVLVNEEMVESYSHGTPQMRRRVEKDIGILRGFRNALASRAATPGPPGRTPAWDGDPAAFAWDEALSRARWPRAGAAPGLLESYEACLAIPGDAYFPVPGRVDALIRKLEESLSRQGEPLYGPPRGTDP